jgi:hypothetical protein
MAKKDEQKPKGNGGKSRMKVFVAGFEMEGNDEVMAEGFKAIRELSTAISRNTVLPPALVSKPALSGPKPETADEGATVESEEIEQPNVEVEDVDTEDADETRDSNGSGTKRSYNFKTPTFLNNLDVTKAKKENRDLANVHVLLEEVHDHEVFADHVLRVLLRDEFLQATTSLRCSTS